MSDYLHMRAAIGSIRVPQLLTTNAIMAGGIWRAIVYMQCMNMKSLNYIYFPDGLCSISCQRPPLIHMLDGTDDIETMLLSCAIARVSRGLLLAWRPTIVATADQCGSGRSLRRTAAETHDTMMPVVSVCCQSAL